MKSISHFLFLAHYSNNYLKALWSARESRLSQFFLTEVIIAVCRMCVNLKKPFNVIVVKGGGGGWQLLCLIDIQTRYSCYCNDIIPCANLVSTYLNYRAKPYIHVPVVCLQLVTWLGLAV